MIKRNRLPFAQWITLIDQAISIDAGGQSLIDIGGRGIVRDVFDLFASAEVERVVNIRVP